MKCIKCGTDNNLRDRTAAGGRCKSCEHPFVFDPQSSQPRITDGFFAKLIADLSAENTLFFTDRQLYYWLNQRLYWKFNPSLGAGESVGCLGFGAAFILLTMGALWWAVLLVVSSSFSTVLGRKHRLKHLRTQPKRIEVYVAKLEEMRLAWEQVNGTIEKRIDPAQITAAAQRPLNVTPGIDLGEITNYSFDRVLVCDRDELAYLLIANNLHFEHNCAIVSIHHYPQGIFETLMTMLRRNPQLQVFALHDASPRGIQLLDSLRQPDWFPDPAIPIYDLGLLPRQVFQQKRPFFEQSPTQAEQAKMLSPRIRQSLTPEEIAWLEAGNTMAIDLFSPQRLLRVVAQGISRSRMGNLTSDASSIGAGAGPDFIFYDFGGVGDSEADRNSRILFADNFG